MQYTEDELEMRYQMVRSAIASQRLAGLEPDSEAIEDMMREARGEITLNEVRTRFLTRVKNGDI